MGLKHNKVLLGKALLVLVILLLGGLAISGCVGYGTAPKGWSGGTIANGTLFLGSMQGKLVALNASDGARLWEVTLETTKPEFLRVKIPSKNNPAHPPLKGRIKLVPRKIIDFPGRLF